MVTVAVDSKRRPPLAYDLRALCPSPSAVLETAVRW